ncbi:MAG: redoxin domain-containing protein [Planctomycetaceae bacterium]
MQTGIASRLGRVACAAFLAMAGGFCSPTASRAAEESPPAPAHVLQRIRRHTFHPLHEGFTKDAMLDRHGIADLANDDWLVRTLAVRDLVLVGLPGIPAVVDALNDDNLHVRQVCTLVLGILPISDATPETRSALRQALEERLKSDPEPVVRSEAAIALGRLGDRSSLDRLADAAKDDSSRDVRHQCTLAVDRISKEVSDGMLFEAYRSLDESTFNTVAVGRPAGDFTLRDTDGNPWTLSDYRGKKHVVLIWIFADWCPVCHGEFHELLEMQPEFADAQVEVVTIQCHEPYRCRVMVGQELVPQYWFAKQQAPQVRYRQGLWWRHLSDPAGAVGATYGVQPLAFSVHSEYINRPATVIVDKDGVVRFAYYGTYWGDRPTIRQTLNMLRSGEFAFEHPKRLHAIP